MSATSKLAILFLAWLALPAADAAVQQPTVREWTFRVLLNDSEIGDHRFRLEREGDSRYVESDARFDVRFLFFNAYRYRHSNHERWVGPCLQSIETQTDVNGDDVVVSGRKEADRFVVETDTSVSELPDCVMSFAYWDPQILEQPRLLNAQTGEYLDVAVERLAEDVLVVRGRPVPAEGYRLTAKGVQIDLWYSEDDEWLALESPARGGRIIRYELT